jgi:hypothetical protein
MITDTYTGNVWPICDGCDWNPGWFICRDDASQALGRHQRDQHEVTYCPHCGDAWVGEALLAAHVKRRHAPHREGVM